MFPLGFKARVAVVFMLGGGICVKVLSHYACAFASASAFASNCNIVSVECCVKQHILCICVKLQTKTHSVNGPLQVDNMKICTQS